MIEQKAYRDTWGRGLDGYLQWFHEAVAFLYELLNESGSLYVHCDSTVNSMIRLVLDETFGRDNFRNEIIWEYTKFAARATGFSQNHDTLFWVSKSSQLTYNEERIPVDRPRQQTARVWDAKQKKAIQKRDDSGNLIYYEQTDKAVDDVWDDIQIVNPVAHERLGYPTQKPEALLERIIQASSNENDLVLDCFCGSGTTAAVAEKLNRRWITCDLGRFAIHTTRKRLLSIPNVRPFVVQNLGQYERQVWQAAEFGEQAEATVRAYRHFILGLYHAEPVEGYVWLHGKKGGRMVHVGTVDAPITPAEVTQIAAEFRKAIGTGKDAPRVAGVDVLGWDFALEMNETIKQQAQTAGLDVRFLKIPREVLEKKAVEQGDIRFFELAALGVDVQQSGRMVAVTLTDFMVSPTDVPEEVIKAVKQWSEWIDYWAVDFTYWGDTFHNQWQSYRTRKDRSLQLSVTETYDEPGEYTIMVKVIDILGNDTTKAITVQVV